MPRPDIRDREVWWHADFVGMFGMTEMECGVADIVNKARAEGLPLIDVQFTAADLTSDSDAFRELQANSWLVPSPRGYRLHHTAVRRIHLRFPKLA